MLSISHPPRCTTNSVGRWCSARSLWATAPGICRILYYRFGIYIRAVISQAGESHRPRAAPGDVSRLGCLNGDRRRIDHELVCPIAVSDIPVQCGGPTIHNPYGLHDRARHCSVPIDEHTPRHTPRLRLSTVDSPRERDICRNALAWIPAPRFTSRLASLAGIVDCCNYRSVLLSVEGLRATLGRSLLFQTDV